MLAKAKALKYDYVNPTDIEYMVVQGYGGRQTASFAPKVAEDEVPQDTLNPEYTRSLSEVLFQGLMKFNAMETKRIL